jgi:uncharacterized spore protein YtfJ
MKDRITKIVSNLLDGVHGLSKSETIIGEPQQAGEATVIPVHRLKIAFGAGSGQAGARRENAGADSGIHGAGGAVELDPVAAIAIGKDGHAHLLTVEADTSSMWAALLQEVPGIVSKIANTVTERMNHELTHRGASAEGGEGGREPALPKRKAPKET